MRRTPRLFFARMVVRHLACRALLVACAQVAHDFGRVPASGLPVILQRPSLPALRLTLSPSVRAGQSLPHQSRVDEPTSLDLLCAALAPKTTTSSGMVLVRAVPLCQECGIAIAVSLCY